MDKKTMDKLFKEIAKYRMIQEETENVLQSLESQVKEYMSNNNIEELIGKEHKATYKLISRDRIDGKRFTAEHPRLAKQYTVDSSYMRFNFR